MTIVAKVNAIFGNVEDVLVVNEQLLAALSAVIAVDVGQKSGVCTGTHTHSYARIHACAPCARMHTQKTGMHAHMSHVRSHSDRHARTAIHARTHAWPPSFPRTGARTHTHARAHTHSRPQPTLAQPTGSAALRGYRHPV